MEELCLHSVPSQIISPITYVLIILVIREYIVYSKIMLMFIKTYSNIIMFDEK